MVILAVVFFPHRVNERAIGLAVDDEFFRNFSELPKGHVGVTVRRPFGDLDVPWLARGITTFEPHIADLGYRSGSNAGKAAFAQDSRFQSELWCEPAAHLRISRGFSGLVVEDGVTAVGALFNPVSARGEKKINFSERDGMFARHLGENLICCSPTLALPATEPASNPEKTRPPERPRFLVVFEFHEMFLTKCSELGHNVGRQGVGELLRKFANRFMDESAPVGSTRRRVDGLERK